MVRTRSLLLIAALAGFALTREARAQTTVVTTFEEPWRGGSLFDEALSTYDGIEFMPWGSIYGVDTWRYTNVDYLYYTAHSGTTRAYFTNSDVNSTARFRFTTPGTSFAGAWVAGPDYFSSVGFDLYAGGILVLSTPTVYTTSTPTFIATGYTGAVDSVYVNARTSFDESASGYYVLDDFEYTIPGQGGMVAPEPASVALMATGLLGLGGLSLTRRRRD